MDVCVFISLLGVGRIKHGVICLLLFALLVCGLIGGCYAVDYGSCEVISGCGYTTGVNEGYFVHYSFYNYCPLCGHRNCLERGLKRNDELSCWFCRADYSFSGKEKLYCPRAWLVPYSPKPEPVVENVTTQPVAKTPLDLAKERVQSYSHPFFG